MKQTKNFNISVPELGDKPDITQVSNAIQDLEDALSGTLEAMVASVSGSKITFSSPSRTTKRTQYYGGMSIQFIAPIQIAENSVTTASVDNLPEQQLYIPYLINAGESTTIYYDGTKFIGGMTAIPKSASVTLNSNDTVATSLAIKTANDNANSRVSKSGDTMTGTLKSLSGVPIEFISGRRIVTDPTDKWIAFTNSSGHGVTFFNEDGSVNFGGATTAAKFLGPLQGNADTATKLQTKRQINGTDFDGTSNITTSTWGTARNIQIGKSTKSVNGGANTSYSLSEIGAINKEGDSTTGTITCQTIGEGFGVAFMSDTGTPATNRTGIFGGNDCYGLEKANNLNIKSWYGTSFSASQSSTPTISFNNRTGDAIFNGLITAGGSQVVTDHTQFMNKRHIINSHDWNSIQVSGVYDVRGASGSNRPSAYGYGILLVHNIDGFFVQQYYPDQPDSSAYFRVHYNGLWRSWSELTTASYRGILECGQYIDMHRQGSGADFDARISVLQNEATLDISGVNKLLVGGKTACIANINGVQIRSGQFIYTQGAVSMSVNFSEAFPTECIAIILQECHSDPSWTNNVIKPLNKNNLGFGVASNNRYATTQTYIAIGR